jgi:hypothetical protein
LFNFTILRTEAKKPKMRLFLSFIIVIISFPTFSQGEWELRKEDEGIKVYTREVEGSKIQEYKAEALVDASLSEIVAVLKDVENHDKLFSHNIVNELLEQTDTFQVQYSVTDIPWPMSDRDGVFSYRYKQDYFSKDVYVYIKAETGYVEENKKYVRISDAKGFWLLEPMDTKKVQVTFQMHANSGGNIPSWLINMFIVDSPLKDMKNLRERVKLDRYTDQKFDFLVEY